MKSIILNKKTVLELKPRVQFVVFKFLCVDYLAFCKKGKQYFKVENWYILTQSKYIYLGRAAGDL